MHIARLARRRLVLDQVWLMVSPGNPLKSADGMGSFTARLASAWSIGDGRRIVATDIERRLGTRFTIDTLARLHRLFPRIRFVWLMGADILVQLPRWRHWERLARGTAMAVLPRPSYNHRALASQATRRLHAARRPAHGASALAAMPAPAWTFLPAPQHAASATAIRAAGTPHAEPGVHRHR